MKDKSIFRSLIDVLLTTMLFSASIGAMASDLEIENILVLSEAPSGVVFEVASGNENYLKTALDKFDRYQKQLRKKFPDLDLALVTHGKEQFALTTDNRKKYADTHERIERISADVPVHICETHASWYDVQAEDYPDYITVSATGPAQVRLYKEMGYILVVL